MENRLKKRLIQATAVAAGVVAPMAFAMDGVPSATQPSVKVDTKDEPIAAGPFQPTWESLQQYKVPDWYRDAKFGIWAHWGPQCQPEDGDWYARNMYIQGNKQYDYHVKTYGHLTNQWPKLRSLPSWNGRTHPPRGSGMHTPRGIPSAPGKVPK